MSRSELQWSGHVGPAQWTTAGTLGCNGGGDSRFVITVPETPVRRAVCGPRRRWRHRADAQTGYGLGLGHWLFQLIGMCELRSWVYEGAAGKATCDL